MLEPVDHTKTLRISSAHIEKNLEQKPAKGTTIH